MARKTKAQKLAALINELEVAAMMIHSPDSSPETVEVFRMAQARATVALADTFGIPMVCADMARKRLAKAQQAAKF